MFIKMALLGFLGSAFPVILFNIDRKKIVCAGLAGALGWLIYNYIFTQSGSSVIASFTGAFAVGLFSEILARLKHTPASMFCIPGIFPLVPGIIAYRTVTSILQNEINEALSSGILMVAIGGAISLGIMLSSILATKLFASKNKK